ncbi:MAG: hypothetical protein ABI743_02665 [bacterium]
MPSTDWTQDHFRELFDHIECYLEERYELPVIISDVRNPFTGDLTGAAIKVDYDVTPEEAVFIVIHLFGHTVQWCTEPTARDTAYAQEVKQDASRIGALQAYETEAVQYSLQLLHDLDITELDQWVSDYAACDFAFLLHFYVTGEKRDFKSFWKDHQPLLTPKPIPEFEPSEWKSRWEGVVV